MLPGDAYLAPMLMAPPPTAPPARAGPTLDRPRKPGRTGGPEGPWWRRPIAPQ